TDPRNRSRRRQIVSEQWELTQKENIMELSELNPGIFRKLTIHLVGEQQFRSDPAGSALKTFEWLHRVIADDETQEPSHSRNAEIQQLIELTKAKGISTIATDLQVAVGTLKNWISGLYRPSAANLQKIKAFLANQGELASPNAAGAKESAG